MASNVGPEEKDELIRETEGRTAAEKKTWSVLNEGGRKTEQLDVM